MNPNNEKYAQALRRLLGIMNELRAKCPWDRKQTLESLRHLTCFLFQNSSGKKGF
jgi:XTP/dITP diphosphohydrolase